MLNTICDMGGWVKIHRKIVDNWVAKDRCLLGAWLVMLVSANYYRTRVSMAGGTIEVGRGQLIGDLSGLAGLLFGDSSLEEKTAMFLNELQKDNMITAEYIGSVVLVTIKNYAHYQIADESSSFSYSDILNIIKEEEKKGFVWRGEILPVIEEWLAYKRGKRRTYKPIGLKHFITHLHSLSGGDVEMAKRITQQSMQNEWLGIFPLRQPYGITQNNEPPEKTAAERQYLDFLKAARRT